MFGYTFKVQFRRIKGVLLVSAEQNHIANLIAFLEVVDNNNNNNRLFQTSRYNIHSVHSKN